MKAVFNARQVAEMVGVHQRTIRNHIKQGKLPASKIGRSYVITVSDLAEYLGSEDRARDVVEAYQEAA